MVATERTLINESGRCVVADLCDPISLLMGADKSQAWMLPDLARKYIIPGLDSNFCKCPQCNGIHWVDESMRRQIREDKKFRIAEAQRDGSARL